MEDLSYNKDFKQALDIKQEPYQYTKTKVKAFVTIISALCLNTMKFDYTVYTYLKKVQLYVKSDLFMHNNVVSIGKITCVHPKMVNREDYIKEIRRSIAYHAPPDIAVVHKWMLENGHKMDGKGAPVADYKLSVTAKKFGDKADK
eukprot:15030962-Ditylum_brightwellii.AAC.2